MNSHTLAHNIEDNLRNFDQRALREASTAFLNTLGYYSRRTGENLGRDRFNRLKAAAAGYSDPSKTYCVDDWEDFHILFQVADDEIRSQGSLFESGVVDDELIRSYLFVTMQLDGGTYTRTQLSNITRLINRQNPKVPIMVLFRYGESLTIAITDRRPNLQDETKRVLEKVTFIKDINLKEPHAAHRKILTELSLERLIETEGVRNFDTLHKAWADTLNTEPLTREFYGKLYEWYQWAVAECRFPDNNNELQVIRLITRLLFVWFLKEKRFEGRHLVPPDLFEKDHTEEHLNHFDLETSDYYQAVLQNLFFATLNTQIDDRCFGTEASTYHYADLLRNPQAFLEALKQVPFVNGGLFDCHVTEECFTDDANDRQNLHVPAKLFFHPENGIFPLFMHYKFTVKENTPVEQEVALDPELLGQVFENLLGAYNPETQTTARKATGSYYTPRQIVEFMVDETLISYFLQKVRPYDDDKEFFEERLREDLLDYESQGKEGADTEHLIHEDEIKYLIQAIDELKIIDPAVGSGAFPMDILNKLVLILQKLDPQNEHWKQRQLQHASQIPDPESQERAKNAIEDVFSAENYHNDYGRKLYLIQNCIYGIDIQPFAITIAKLRFFISLVIEQEANRASEYNYGIRPLPNLETKLVAANTLIGLKNLHDPEIQLLLEDNMVQPLLRRIQELRGDYFSVNTPEGKQDHIEQDKALRHLLDSTLDLQHEAWRIQEQNRIREQIERLPTESARHQLRVQLDREFRRKEAKINEGWAEAKRLAQWEFYDLNAAAEFFEAEYMFGVKDGFDIAIGNPPYIRQEKIRHLKPAFQIQFEDFFTSTADISVYFYKRAAELLRDSGILTYICTNKFMRTGYGRNLRQFLTENMSLHILLDFGSVSVFDAAVDTCITLIENCPPATNYLLRTGTLREIREDSNVGETFHEQAFSQQVSQLSSEEWTIARPETLTLLRRLQNTGRTLGECAGRIYFGLKTGCNDAFRINADTRDWLIDEDAGSEELIQPLFRGRDLSKWRTNPTGYYIIAIASSANREWPWSDAADEWEAEDTFAEYYPAIFEHLRGYRERLIDRNDIGKFYWELRSCAYYAEIAEPKIVYRRIAQSIDACYDQKHTYVDATTFFIPTDDLSLLAIFNSQLFDWFSRHTFYTHQDPWAGGGLEYLTQHMKNVPIADMTQHQKAELAHLVEQILAAPNGDDTPALEREIDAFVYELYGLTDTEIELIQQTYREAGMEL